MTTLFTNSGFLVGLLWLLAGLGWLIASSDSKLTKQSLSAWLLFGACAALLVGPVLVYSANLMVHRLSLALFISDGLVAIGLAIRYRAASEFWRLLKADRPLQQRYLLNLLVSTTFVLILAHLEKFLPEYDGYVHERMASLTLSSVATGNIQSVYRPGFYYLVALFKHFYGLQTIIYSKFVFPIILTVLTVEGLQLLRPAKKSWQAWLVVFSAPLMISQLIYFRAQSFAVMIFPLCVFTYLIQKNRRLQLAIFSLTIFGAVFFHIFFVFAAILGIPTLVSWVASARNWSKREQLLLAASALLVVALVILLAVLSKDVIGQYITFKTIHFIANPLAINTGGGVSLNSFNSLLKFYLHHIIYLALLILIIAIPFRRKLLVPTIQLLYLIGVFLFFAEVLPRFGFQYDQERVWVFINILAICCALLLADKSPLARSDRLIPVLSVVAAISLLTTSYFIHTRAKPFSGDDYAAVQFINQHYSNAVVVGPEVKAPGIDLFKNDSVFYYIAFTNLLDLSPSTLSRELRQIGQFNVTAIHQKQEQKALNLRKINQLLLATKPVPTPLTESLPDPIGPAHQLLVYVCNNINGCDSLPAWAATQATALGRVYHNSSVSLYLLSPDTETVKLTSSLETDLENAYISSYIKAGLPYQLVTF